MGSNPSQSNSPVKMDLDDDDDDMKLESSCMALRGFGHNVSMWGYSNG